MNGADLLLNCLTAGALEQGVKNVEYNICCLQFTVLAAEANTVKSENQPPISAQV